MPPSPSADSAWGGNVQTQNFSMQRSARLLGRGRANPGVSVKDRLNGRRTLTRCRDNTKVYGRWIVNAKVSRASGRLKVNADVSPMCRVSSRAFGK